MLELAKTLRYDLTAAQAKLTDLMEAISNLPGAVMAKHPCPRCGVDRPTHLLLLEHLANVHDDPDARQQLAAQEAA